MDIKNLTDYCESAKKFTDYWESAKKLTDYWELGAPIQAFREYQTEPF